MKFTEKNLFEILNKNREFENYFSQLKDSIYYGQQLSKITNWIYDKRNDEILWTAGIYNILECGINDFDGDFNNYYLYVHPDDLDMAIKFNQEALNGKECDIEYKITTTNGTIKYLNERTKTLYDETNTPVKIVGIIQDITEHKILENKLKGAIASLKQRQAIAETGDWKYDVIKGEFIGTEEMYRLFGIEPYQEKIDFNSFIKLIFPEDRKKVLDAIDNNLKGNLSEVEFRITQYDGTEKSILSKGKPLFDKERTVLCILGTFIDITERKLWEESLKKVQINLFKAQSLANIGSWEMDIVERRNYWSEQVYKILGISLEDYDGTYKGFLKFVYPDDIGTIHNYLENPPAKPFDMEFRIVRPDGTLRNVYQQLEFIFDKDHNPKFIYGTIQDITEKKAMEKEIESKQEEINDAQKRFEVLVKESSDVFEIIDSEGIIQYISNAAEKITGYTQKERIGKKTYEFFRGEDLKRYKDMIEVVLKDIGKEAKGDFMLKGSNGKDVYVDVYMQNMLHEPSIKGIVINFRDITSRIEMEKKMNYISNHDELTKLPNYLYFKKHLSLKCQYAKETDMSFSVMMLDLDGLKNISYTLGYEFKNDLVIKIVERLERYLGKDTFISRYSEDLFAIIVDGISSYNEYEDLAKSLVQLVSKPYLVDKYELDIWTNIGICIYSEDSQDMESIIKQSKVALFRSKKEGKNTYKFHSSDLDVQNYKEFILRNDLHHAIENEELRVFYQPIVNIKTGEIVAAEALIRWEHPEWGMISPNEFIPIAEETGIIINMGKWILKQVCSNYKKWIDKDLPNIKVSVNFSSIQFLENDFVEKIKAIIDDFELNPNFLILEITESIFMKNAEKAIWDIKKLQSLGIQVALDDFGTGFSSLAYLNSFNLDVLKIDRSFIKDISTDETSAIITKTIINMTRDLKLKLVAEGIEDWQQLVTLRDLGCYAGQGYIFSKPVNQSDFIRFLANKKCNPVISIDEAAITRKERRGSIRIEFDKLLKTLLTISEINGKRIISGDAKILVKNIGHEGLCFISNIKIPVVKSTILKFETKLLGNDIKVKGYPIWIEEIDDNLYEYGVNFVLDKDNKIGLINILNQVRINMNNNGLLDDESFISTLPKLYFESIN